MWEYVDEAIILDKRESGHQDVRYSVFTKRFGKMVAKAKSARKVTSKLAGHLEPGSASRVRLIEVHGLQVVDALREEYVPSLKVDNSGLLFLRQLDRILAEWEPEPYIWTMVRQGFFDWSKILAVLGWDPADAVCSVCHAFPAAGFSVVRQEFFCGRCVVKMPRMEMISLGEENKILRS